MTKANLVLAGAAVVFGVGCLVLFRDLSSERNRVHALETQVAQLQRDLKRPRTGGLRQRDSTHKRACAERSYATCGRNLDRARQHMPAANKPIAAKERR